MNDDDVKEMKDKIDRIYDALYVGNERPSIMSRLEKIEDWMKNEIATAAKHVDWGTWLFRAGFVAYLTYLLK